MSRRTQRLARRQTLVALGALVLTGCGFQLRRPVQYPFQSIAVTGPGVLAALVRRDLKGQGTVRVLPADAPLQEAEVVCEIGNETRSSNIAASTSGGSVRELTLSNAVSFRLRTQAGKELVGWTPLSQTRDISYNETAALAKENEQVLLYRDMNADIAAQIVRRIGFVKTL